MLALAITVIVTIQADRVEFVKFIFALFFIVLCLRQIPERELAVKSFKVRVIKLLLLLGAASYSLYFTHIFLLGIAARIAKMVHFHLPFLLYFSILAIVAAILAVLVYWSFEKPSQVILKRLFNLRHEPKQQK
ncbi:MAG TPA: hypothetical protein VIZ65_04750 [Cellvibrionaceae bacterium]